MHIGSIGIDLGKTTFHLVALGERSRVLVRKSFHARNCWPIPDFGSFVMNIGGRGRKAPSCPFEKRASAQPHPCIVLIPCDDDHSGIDACDYLEVHPDTASAKLGAL
jgi:hypothetical protein